MRAIADLVFKGAHSTTPILLRGESGTGKTTLAQLIHKIGARGLSPMISWPCSTVSVEGSEAELFGHRGAYSGRGGTGIISAAGTGTILLEEISDLPRILQLKLTHALETGQFRPLGATVARPFQARLIATTSADLEALISRGHFSRELFYRLSTCDIRLPPLREHPEDIPVMMDYFLSKASEREARLRPVMPVDAIRAYSMYGWPGNVRELEARCERSVVLGMVDMPVDLEIGKSITNLSLPRDGLPAYVEHIERTLIEQALERTRGNQTKAAELLHLSFRQFRYKLQRLGCHRK